MLGNYPEESIQHSEHGESLKSRINQISYKLLTTHTHTHTVNKDNSLNFNHVCVNIIIDAIVYILHLNTVHVSLMY